MLAFTSGGWSWRCHINIWLVLLFLFNVFLLDWLWFTWLIWFSLLFLFFRLCMLFSIWLLLQYDLAMALILGLDFLNTLFLIVIRLFILNWFYLASMLYFALFVCLFVLLFLGLDIMIVLFFHFLFRLRFGFAFFLCWCWIWMLLYFWFCLCLFINCISVTILLYFSLFRLLFYLLFYLLFCLFIFNFRRIWLGRLDRLDWVRLLFSLAFINFFICFMYIYPIALFQCFLKVLVIYLFFSQFCKFLIGFND